MEKKIQGIMTVIAASFITSLCTTLLVAEQATKDLPENHNLELINQLKKEHETLRQDLDTIDFMQDILVKSHDDLSKEINEQSDDISDLQIETSPRTIAAFKPGEKGFTTIETGLGKIYVTLEDVQPYANGYKIKFRVGNPSFATLVDGNAEFTWGEEQEDGEKYVEWKEKLRTEEIAINEPLLPGRWNIIEVTAAPAEKHEIGFLQIKLLTINYR